MILILEVLPGDDGGDDDCGGNEDPIPRTIRNSVGAYIRRTDRTILCSRIHSTKGRAILHSTKGHTIRPGRTGRTSHGICMACMPMCSSNTSCCTMDRSVCSNTMNFQRCTECNMTMGRCYSSSRTGYSLHLRLCRPSPCHTISWRTCRPGSLPCLSSLRKDISLMPWSSPPRHRSLPSTPAFLPLT